MKIQKYLFGFVLFLLAFSSVSQANHLIGGDVEYKFIKKVGSNSAQYSITIKIYANELEQARIPEDDGNITIGIYESDPFSETQKKLYVERKLYFVDSTTVSVDGPAGCNFKFPGYQIVKWEFSDTITLPMNTDGYHIVFARCCRITASLNFDVTASSNTKGETFYGYIPPTDVSNNSATFSKVPLPFLCYGDTLTANNFATDIDGDSLVYSLVNPYSDAYGGGAGGTTIPSAFITWPIVELNYNSGYDLNNLLGTSAAGGYASIDPFTGIARYKPDQNGKYIVAIEVREYRKGVLVGVVRRDLQIFTRICSANQTPPDYSTTSGAQTEFHIRAGQALCFPITFTYPADSLVFIEISGDLFTNPNIANKPTLTGPTEGIRTVTQQFCWDTNCDQASTIPYTFVVSGKVGCPAQSADIGFKIYVDSIQPPVVGRSLVCPFEKNDIYSVTDTSNSAFVWSVTGGSFTQLADTAISVNWNTLVPGKVFCTETTTDGCIGTKTFIASIDRSLRVFANAPGSAICSGDTINLGPTTAAPTGTYVWSAKDGAPISALSRKDTSNIKFVYENTGTADIVLKYYFEVFTPDGCYSIDSATITVHPRPVISLSSNMPSQGICLGDAVTLKASKAFFTTGAVTWTDAATQASVGAGDSIVVTPLANTTYNAKITDANSCTNLFSITITVNPPPEVVIFNPGKDTVCLGTPVNLVGLNAVSYAWIDVSNPNDTTIAPNIIVTPSATTDYQVIGTDSKGCTNTYTRKVVILPLPDINTTTPTVFMCPGIPTNISITSTHLITAFEWKQLDSMQVLSGTANVLVSPSVNSTYVIKLTDDKGCVNTRHIPVDIYPSPVTSGIDAITPSVCPGYKRAIYKAVDGLANSTFEWIVKGGVFTPSTVTNADSLSVDWDNKEDTLAYIKVIETTVNGCIGDTVTLPIRVEYQLHPPAPNGLKVLCSRYADTVSYNVNPLPGSIYTWTVSGGSIVSIGDAAGSKIKVDWNLVSESHTISYREDNGPCYGFSPIVSVVVNPSPSTTDVSGRLSVCSGGTGIYGLNGLTGSKYTWMLPQTSMAFFIRNDSTASTEVQWPQAFILPIKDTLKVVEQSDKGCMGDTLMIIVTINLPHSPDKILGSDYVCVDPDNVALTPIYAYVQQNGLPGSKYDWSIVGSGATIVRTANDSAYIKFTDLSISNKVVLTVQETTADSCLGLPISKEIRFDYTKPYIQMAGTRVKNPLQIEVRWDSSYSTLGNERSYHLFKRKLYSNEAWENLGVLSSNTYLDNAVKTTEFAYEYLYKVLNYCEDTATSRNQNTIFLIGKGIETDNKIELKWNSYHNWEGGVLQYQLWKRLDQDADYSLMKDMSASDTSTVLENGGDAFVHHYRIRAIQNTSGIVRDSWSNDVTINFEHKVKIPNVITPNSDGSNDTWKIANLSSYKNATIQVYNRWGGIVYSFVGTYQNDWDGTSQGKDLPDGTYFYVINLNELGAKGSNFQGNITIVR